MKTENHSRLPGRSKVAKIPDQYIRIAALDRNGKPILNPGEGGVFADGVFYVIDDQITLQ